MRITRAKKRFNPKTGERKYYKIEVKCEACSHTRRISEEELLEALSKSGIFIRFRCGVCKGVDVCSINREWFSWHRHNYDIFPIW